MNIQRPYFNDSKIHTSVVGTPKSTGVDLPIKPSEPLRSASLTDDKTSKSAIDLRFSERSCSQLRVLREAPSFNKKTKTVSISHTSLELDHDGKPCVEICNVYTKNTWCCYEIRRLHPDTSYYANDLFMFNLLRAREIVDFEIPIPKQIIIYYIENEKTLSRLTDTHIDTPEWRTIFLTDTPLGKMMGRILKESKLEITSINSSKCVLERDANLVICVKPQITH